MVRVIAGVDVSKDTLEACKGSKGRPQRFDNTPTGITSLVTWLGSPEPSATPQVVLEPTSTYHHALVDTLQQRGVSCTIINPARTKAFAGFNGKRAKTDKVDARLLAQMGEERELPATPPVEPDREELKTMRRHRQWLEEEAQRVDNRLGAARQSPRTPKAVIKSLERTHKDLLEEAQRMEEALQQFLKEHLALQKKMELLLTIPAVGPRTALLVLCELPPVELCDRSKKWVAFCGLEPAVSESGNLRTTAMSRKGPAAVRAALYMPALVALRWNPLVRVLGKRLKERGKTSKERAVAAMAKLVRLCYGVLKNGKPFDPAWHLQKHKVVTP